MIRSINADALIEWMNRHELTEDGGIDFNELEEQINKMAVVRDIEPEDTIARQDAIMAICRTCTDDGEYYRDCKMYQIGICADAYALETVPESETPARCIATISIDKDESVETCINRLKREYGIEEKAQRPPGKWRHVATIRSNECGEMKTYHMFKCSECDYEGNPDWPYCPHCGSPMA